MSILYICVCVCVCVFLVHMPKTHYGRDTHRASLYMRGKLAEYF
jgi:hypothetical protein